MKCQHKESKSNFECLKIKTATMRVIRDRVHYRTAKKDEAPRNSKKKGMTCEPTLRLEEVS